MLVTFDERLRLRNFARRPRTDRYLITLDCMKRRWQTTIAIALVVAPNLCCLRTRDPNRASSNPEITTGNSSPYAYVISAGQIILVIDTTIEDLAFRYSIDTMHPCLETSDARFVSPEGLKIGSQYKTVEGVALGKLQLMPGWGSYFELPSGWKACFIALEYSPTSIADSTVATFFKLERLPSKL